MRGARERERVPHCLRFGCGTDRLRWISLRLQPEPASLANNSIKRMENQLLEATDANDVPTVLWILQQPGGVNVNARGEYGLTALHIAVLRGYSAIVQAILQAEGVNVNVRAVLGNIAPLHLACCGASSNSLFSTQALLEAGADPNATDDDRDTPLYNATRLGPISVVEALLDSGADPKARNRHNKTPLHGACRYGRLDVFQALIRRCGPDLEYLLTLESNGHKTPLDCLQDAPLDRKEEADRIRELILQSYAGMLARRYGLLCLHSVLQDAAFIEQDDEFQLPVGRLNTEQLQTLLEFTAAAERGSIRALDNDGLLPLQVACQLNFPDLVLNVLLRSYPDALLSL